MRTAAEWNATIAEAYERAKVEIKADEASGRLPKGIRTFAELHDHVDANEYGGLCEDGWGENDAEGCMSEATQDAANRVQDLLQAWLQARCGCGWDCSDPACRAKAGAR